MEIENPAKLEIRRSEYSDISDILHLYEKAREFMAATGNPNQWAPEYPGEELIKRDIKGNHSYVCVDEGEIAGTFAFMEGPDPTYNKIYEGNWLDDRPYGVVHRIASAKGSKGVASYCLKWCIDQCRNLRIDTHRNNAPMHNLLQKLGFTQCGIIYLENGDERIAYQKIIQA